MQSQIVRPGPGVDADVVDQNSKFHPFPELVGEGANTGRAMSWDFK